MMVRHAPEALDEDMPVPHSGGPAVPVVDKRFAWTSVLTAPTPRGSGPGAQGTGYGHATSPMFSPRPQLWSGSPSAGAPEGLLSPSASFSPAMREPDQPLTVRYLAPVVPGTSTSTRGSRRAALGATSPSSAADPEQEEVVAVSIPALADIAAAFGPDALPAVMAAGRAQMRPALTFMHDVVAVARFRVSERADDIRARALSRRAKAGAAAGAGAERAGGSASCTST